MFFCHQILIFGLKIALGNYPNSLLLVQQIQVSHILYFILFPKNTSRIVNFIQCLNFILKHFVCFIKFMVVIMYSINIKSFYLIPTLFFRFENSFKISLLKNLISFVIFFRKTLNCLENLKNSYLKFYFYIFSNLIFFPFYNTVLWVYYYFYKCYLRNILFW